MENYNQNIVLDKKIKNKLLANPALGNAQPLTAGLLTPKGYIKMGDVMKGDEILGSDGKTIVVLDVYPQGEREIFEVIFHYGSKTECTDDHLWFTQTRKEKQKRVAGSVRTLSTIRQSMVSVCRSYNHSVPRVPPIEFSKKNENLPIDPWLLGMYLGDGNSSGTVVISNSENDIQIRISKTLPEGDTCVLSGNLSNRIKRTRRSNKPATFVSILKVLGLHGLRSWEKFIPNEYLFSTVENRLKILQGLLDSDGYVMGAGGIEYVTVSTRLAAGVKFLAKSLCADVSVAKKKPTYTYKGKKLNGRLAYRLNISMKSDLLPVSSDKHLKKWRIPTWSRNNAIKEVRYIGKRECQSIKVDALDSLYITDDFILTHDSNIEGYSCEEQNDVQCRQYHIRRLPNKKLHPDNESEN